MMYDEQSSQPIQIQMLGGFRITVGEHTISDTDTRTKQLWHLLQYLITFRNKATSQEEIIKVMWPDRKIENPANALKNLVYRIRTTFAQRNIPYAKEMIVYHHGGYQWNNKLPCIVDVEEFEMHCKNGADISQGEDYQIREYKKAIELYRGDFLPSSQSESWAIHMNSYLRALFFKTVYAKLEILKNRDTEVDYENIILTCRKTLIIDPSEEMIHQQLIHALYKIGKQREALEHYEFVEKQFYSELGLMPSEHMKELYQNISKTVSHEYDIDMLTEELREDREPDGAFYCEYEVFKNLYRLEARTAARTGDILYICMLTISSNEPGKVLSLPIQSTTMDALGKAIRNSLRRGDVYSRFSATQYALMLPTGNEENCEMVMARILKRYREIYKNPEIIIRIKMVPLEPIN